MIAFDTNVLIYACDRADPRRQAIALDLLDSTTDAVLLWQVAGEFIAASRKLADRGFTHEIAWRRLSDFLGVLRLILPGPGVLERARSIHLGASTSFWDAMIVAACVESGVKRLYSEEIAAVALPVNLETVNPFA